MSLRLNGWLLLLVIAGPAQAADRALLLNDQEQKDLVQILDAATKAQGLSIAAATLRLYQKLLAAPTVTEQKEPSNDAK